MNNVRAGIYARQSLDKDGFGLAIDRQLDEDRKLCAARGWTVAAEYVDNDVSAFDRSKVRPEYERLRADYRSGLLDAIAVYDLDRLTRQPRQLEDWIDAAEDRGLRLVTANGEADLSTDGGRMYARIKAAVARAESERKAARQRLANRQLAEAGRARKGTPRPFGWQAVRVSLEPAEAAAIRDACGVLLAGGTISAVIRDWDSRGVYPLQRPRHHPFGPVNFTGWSRTSVREILGNPRNAGIAEYRGAEVGRGEWEPVVAEETYRAVCDVLAANRAGRKVAGRTMLGMLGRCRCGAPVTGSWSGDGRRPAYRCHHLSPQRGEGPHVFVRRDLIDEWVGALVTERLSRPDAAGLLAVPDGTDTAALRDEAAALRERLGRLGPLFAAGMISEQDMTGGRAAGEARLAQIAAELAEAGRESVLAPLVAADDVAAAWERLDVSLKRAAVAALMTVTLVPPGRGAHTWDPADVVRAEWVPSRA